MPSEFRNIRTPLEQVGRFCKEWEQTTLQRACSLVTDGTHDSPKESTFGFPLVTGKCIKGGELKIDAAYLISEEDHKKVLTRSHAQKGDLLFANIGNSIGEVCQIKQEVDISIKNLALFRPSEKLDGIFLLSYLRSKQVQKYIRNSVFGSAQPFIGLGSLREFPVPIPPIIEQKAIAHILSTLDERIELNRKINETLEQIAKALFKSWFIDFDPVRAKAEGRSTGLADEISDLFPDSFEDSDLGKIPNGWEIYSLKDLSSYLSRGISPKYCDQGEGVTVINQKCIRGGIIDFSKSRNHDPLLKKIDGREIQKFDCLINSTGVGTLGRVAITPEIEESTIVDSHVTVVRGKNIEQSLFLAMLLLQRQGEIESLGEGSTGQTELSRKTLGELEIIFPSEKLINQFFISSLSLFKKKWLNEKTILKLYELRNTLLPKLISGELRIPDVEKMIEEIGI